MIVSASGAYAILFGTSFPVDVTNLSGIVVKYEVSGITHTLTLDLRNVSGSYYVAICEYSPYNTNGVLGISLKNTKSLVWDSATAKSNTSEQNRQVYIKEIQLIQS